MGESMASNDKDNIQNSMHNDRKIRDYTVHQDHLFLFFKVRDAVAAAVRF